jgi:hypothetical protein
MRRTIRHSFLQRARREAECSASLAAAFDADWYRSQYANCASSRDPVTHYTETGWKLGYDPCPIFSTSWYACQNPDAMKAGFNPLEHFVQFGWQEGRDPHPLFCTDWYLHQFAGGRDWSSDPLTHYRTTGWRSGRSPHPLFDTDWYLLQMAQHSPGDYSGDPLTHYVTHGWHTGFDPNPLFDSGWYIRRNPQDMESDENPLAHYLRCGAEHGVDPSPLFSTVAYVAAQPQCGGRTHALAHYLKFGRGVALPLPHSLAPGVHRRGEKAHVAGEIPDPSTTRSIAIIAAHDARGTVGSATRHLCQAFANQGFGVVLAYDHAVTPSSGISAPWDALVTREHAGYDFFSWRLALEQFPDDVRFDEIVLLNDSIVGPFTDLGPLLSAWRALPFDVSGLVEAAAPRPHLHSWGVRFGPRCASPSTLLSFYGLAQPLVRKGDAVDFLEIPLADHFRTRGFSTGSVFSQATTITPERNPAIFGWYDLAASGLPFVKREVLALPDAILGQRRIDISDMLANLYPSMSSATIGELVDDSLAQIARPPIFH